MSEAAPLRIVAESLPFEKYSSYAFDEKLTQCSSAEEGNAAMITGVRVANSLAMKPADGAPSRPTREDSSSDDEFVDAVEEIEPEEGSAPPSQCPMSLSEALEQCAAALDRFLNNDLQTAMQLMRPWSQSSLYHSLATSIFEFIPAVLTLDPRQVEVALDSIKHTLALCQRYRRSYSLVESLGTIIKKPNFSLFSELEAHAELCYAEALLLQAALSLLDGEDLAGLLRATLRVKASHTSYKSCSAILQQRQWGGGGGRSRQDFESGVRLGRGAFSILISLLPPRIISLLQYAGFTGDRAEGVQQLVMGSAAGGLRAPLCDLTLLAVQLVVGHFVAAPPDLRLVREILDGRLQQYPEGAWFLLFLGRLQLVEGRARPALATYARVAAVPRLWPQLRHLTYWECMWASSIELQWRDAAEFAGRLLAESAWSRTVYAYARAAFLLQLRDRSPAEQRAVEDLLRCAPRHRQRIAGKSLPMEKLVARRCERWAARAHLALPGLELLCLWNMFPALAADPERARRALQAIDEAEEEVRGAGEDAGGRGGRGGLLPDTDALMLLLRGSMHVAGRRYRDAMPILNHVLEMRDEIQEDTFIVPYAMFEMASCYVSIGDRTRGQSLLREIRSRLDALLESLGRPLALSDLLMLPQFLPARRRAPRRSAPDLPCELTGFPPEHRVWRNFSGFLLESRLQFRLHASLARIRESPDEEVAADHLQMESSSN